MSPDFTSNNVKRDEARKELVRDLQNLVGPISNISDRSTYELLVMYTEAKAKRDYHEAHFCDAVGPVLEGTERRKG